MPRPLFFSEQLTDQDAMNPVQQQMCQIFMDAAERDLAYPAEAPAQVGQITHALDEGEIRTWDGTNWVIAAELSQLLWGVSGDTVSETAAAPIEVAEFTFTAPAGFGFTATSFSPTSVNLTLPNGNTRLLQPSRINFANTSGRIDISWAGDDWPTIAEMNSFSGLWRIIMTYADFTATWPSTDANTGTISTAGVDWELTDSTTAAVLAPHRATPTTVTLKIERYNVPPQASIEIRTNRIDTAAQTITVNTSGGTATPGVDYTAAVNRVVTMPAGQTRVTTLIDILPDTATEGGETFNVVISNPSSGAVSTSTAQVFITDDEVPLTLRLEDSSVAEGSAGNPTLLVTATLSTPHSEAVRFDWATRSIDPLNTQFRALTQCGFSLSRVGLCCRFQPAGADSTRLNSGTVAYQHLPRCSSGAPRTV